MREQTDRGDDQRGFTLVELLVVILIVAILAAIAVPIFLGSRDKGHAAQVQSALKSASTAAESAALTSGGYEILNDNEAVLAANGFNPTEGIQLGITATDSSFCIAATHLRASSRTDWQVGSYSSGVGKPVPGGSTCPEAAVLAGVADPPVVAIVDDTSGSGSEDGSGEGTDAAPVTEPEGSGDAGSDDTGSATGGDGATDPGTGSTGGTTDPGTGGTTDPDPGTGSPGGPGKGNGGGPKKK